MTDDYPIRFGPKSLNFIDKPIKKYNILYGSIRSSKTFTACFKFLKELMKLKESHLHLAGGVSATSSFENNIQNLIYFCDFFGFKYQLKYSEWKFIIYSFNGSKQVVLIKGFNDKQTTAKLKGLTLYGVLLDEMSELDYPGVQMVESRLTKPGSFLIATSNPPVRGAWFDSSYLSNFDKLNHDNYHFEHYELSDNITLSDEYLEHLHSLHKPGSFFYELYILGITSRAEGIIITGFDDSKHVQDIKNEFLTNKDFDKVLYVSIDYNAAIQHSSVLVYHNQVESLILDECVLKAKGNSLTDESFYSAMINKYSKYFNYDFKQNLIFILPHDAKSLKNTISNHGFKTVTYKPETMYSINKINMRFSLNEIKVDSECNEYIKSLNNMVWDKRKSDKGISAPNKDNGADHMFDAGRGALLKKATDLKMYDNKDSKYDEIKYVFKDEERNPIW